MSLSHRSTLRTRYEKVVLYRAHSIACKTSFFPQTTLKKRTESLSKIHEIKITVQEIPKYPPLSRKEPIALETHSRFLK